MLHVKKATVFIFLMFSTLGFSQISTLPKIEWHGTSKSENQYLKLLQLKDGNALIVQVAY